MFSTSSLQAAQRDREWGLWSVYHLLSLPLLPPHSLPLLWCGVSPTGDSASRTTPACVPSTGCSPSGTGCCSVGPPRGHKPCQQTCSSVGFSLHRSAGPGRSLLQRGLPMGSQLPSGIHLLRRGVPSMGCRWISAPPWASMGCRGSACLTVVFSTICGGILASTPGAPSSMSAGLFLSRILTLLSGCTSCCAATFFPFLNILS